MKTEFDTLYSEIQQLSEKSARFRRVALHIHSPQSYDFGHGNCDKALNERSRYLVENGENEFLKHFVGKFDIIAITDHMRVGYACKLVRAAESISEICVLPGMEINLRLAPPLHEIRLHVLVIFPETKTEVEIERIFPPGIPQDNQRSGEEEIILGNANGFRDLSDFIHNIHKHGGFCIAAHVDSDKGIRTLFRQTGKNTLELFNEDGKLSSTQQRDLSNKFKDFLSQTKFHGIEVSKPEDRKHYSWENITDDTVHHVPLFLTFDAHDIESIINCQRFTYVKMTELSWRGLTEAIKFPQTRIRFSDDRVPPPHLLGLEIVSPNNNGFFRQLKVGFAENLNCIIGPRGSGKSAIIDAMRYLFGYNRTLKELENEDLVNAIKNRQKVTLKESRIRVIYRLADNKVHVLEATFDQKSDYVTKVYSLDGKLIPVPDVERSNEYPLRLFGWSEIETLGRDPQRQLDLLDKLIDGLDELSDEKQEIYSLLEQNTQEISGIMTLLDQIVRRNDGEIRKFKEYQQEFDDLNTDEVNTLFQELDRKRGHLDFIKKINSSFRKVKNDLENISLNEVVDLDQEASESEELMEWWSNEKQALAFLEALKGIEDGISTTTEILSIFLDKLSLHNFQIEKDISEIEVRIREKVSADTSKQILAELRSQAKTRLDAVSALKNEYNEELGKLQKELAKRNSLLLRLLGIRRKISRLRYAKKQDIEGRLNEFQTPEMRISLEFLRNGDKSSFESFLQDSSSLSQAHRQFKAKKWPELISRRFTPIQLSQIILRERPSRLIHSCPIDGKEYEIDAENAEKIIAAFYPYGFDDLAEIKTVDQQKVGTLLKIQELDYDDREQILRNNQPIESSSPGQRSSAMLPLIALAESVPLVIDQPEDNLDNRLVGKVLVEILAKLKERRQIIIATHNPNIVVLGDAEQVIVLDAIDDKQGQVEYQASIDDSAIVSDVMDLMEGGKQAFETRNTRYQSLS